MNVITPDPGLKGTRGSRKDKDIAEDEQGSDPYLSRAAAKALQILEFLRTQEEPVSLVDIARRIGLTRASTFRLLRTLEVSSYLTVNAMGMYAFVPEFGSGVPTQLPMRIVKSATPEIREVSRELKETVSLAVLFENRSEVVAVVESNEMIRMSNVVGHILPPNASSLGKVITAFQSQARREKLLRSFGVYRFTEHTITEPASLDQEFEQIRNTGFARDREETVYGGNCFGVPIFSPSGSVVAAISTSIPKMRLGGIERETSIVVALSSVAKRVSLRLT